MASTRHDSILQKSVRCSVCNVPERNYAGAFSCFGAHSLSIILWVHLCCCVCPELTGSPVFASSPWDPPPSQFWSPSRLVHSRTTSSEAPSREVLAMEIDGQGPTCRCTEHVKAARLRPLFSPAGDGFLTVYLSTVSTF